MRYFLFVITFLSLLSCSVDELFGGKDPLIGEWEFNYDDSQCGLITVSKNGEIIITANDCDNSGGGQVFVTNDDGTTSTSTLQPEPDVINNGSWVNNSENANFDDSTQYYDWRFDDFPQGENPLDYDNYIFGTSYLKIEFQDDFNSANAYPKNKPDSEWRSDVYWVLTKIE